MKNLLKKLQLLYTNVRNRMNNFFVGILYETIAMEIDKMQSNTIILI